MLDLYLVDRLIDLWLAEDIGHGDITSLTMIDADATATFHMNARQPIAVPGSKSPPLASAATTRVCGSS